MYTWFQTTRNISHIKPDVNISDKFKAVKAALFWLVYIAQKREPLLDTQLS